MTYKHPLVPGVASGSAWPYSKMPERKVTTGPWKLGMNADGTMVLWPMAERFPEAPDKGVYPIEVAGGNKEELEQFIVAFCRMGYVEEPLYVYQEGPVHIFNWRSFTMSQLYVASQVAHAFLNGDRDGAWVIGGEFQQAIDDAQNEMAH